MGVNINVTFDCLGTKRWALVFKLALFKIHPHIKFSDCSHLADCQISLLNNRRKKIFNIF